MVRSLRNMEWGVNWMSVQELKEEFGEIRPEIRQGDEQ